MSLKKISDLKKVNYEIFILCLSLLSLFNLFLVFLNTTPQTDIVVSTINFFISLIFLADFLFRLFTSDSKSKYFLHQGGWADLLSSIPTSLTYIFRIVRIFSTYKALNQLGYQRIIRTFIGDRANSAILTVSFLIILVMEFGSIFIIKAEATSGTSNIENASDALWWTFVTITTVGYGDQYPTTGQGRIIGFLVMVVGVGLFGVITGYLANSFLSPKKTKEDPIQTNQKLLKDIQKEIKDLKKQIGKK